MVDHAGERHYFCSDHCAERFEKGLVTTQDGRPGDAATAHP